jgi:hypothetical protein
LSLAKRKTKRNSYKDIAAKTDEYITSELLVAMISMFLLQNSLLATG